MLAFENRGMEPFQEHVGAVAGKAKLEGDAQLRGGRQEELRLKKGGEEYRGANRIPTLADSG